jgi:hypothetical protein
MPGVPWEKMWGKMRRCIATRAHAAGKGGEFEILNLNQVDGMAIAMGDDTFVVGKKKKVMSDRWCRC